jgi:hypothetical protein
MLQVETTKEALYVWFSTLTNIVPNTVEVLIFSTLQTRWTLLKPNPICLLLQASECDVTNISHRHSIVQNIQVMQMIIFHVNIKINRIFKQNIQNTPAKGEIVTGAQPMILDIKIYIYPASQDVPRFLWYQKVQCTPQLGPQFFPVLSQFTSIHILTFYLPN